MKSTSTPSFAIATAAVAAGRHQSQDNDLPDISRRPPADGQRINSVLNCDTHACNSGHIVLSCLILSSLFNLNDTNDQLVMRVVFLNINYKYAQKQTKRIFNCHYFVNVRQESIHGNLAFLGLGQMGSPMANNLLQKGIHCRYLMSMHRPSMR